MKRYYPWMLLIAASVLIGWRLYENQKRRRQEAQLSQVQRAFVPVRVEKAKQEWITPHLEVSGIFMPAQEMPVVSETVGRVIAVYKRRGDRVVEGEPIAKVDDELLQVKLQAIRANLAKLRKDRERVSELIEGEAIPRSKIEDLDLGILAAEAEEKLLQKQIANTTIRAPLSGVLTFCAVERGSVVAQGIPVAHITNLDRLLLMVKVSERDVLQVQKNQKVRVVPDVRSDAPLSGQVTNIAPKADSAFTYLVEIAVANSPRSPLLAGMHARAQFVFEQGRQALTIPRRAVVGSLREASVFVVQGDTLAEERRLQIGRSLGERVEVSSGLSADEPVVVEGQTYLSSGARVRVVN